MSVLNLKIFVITVKRSRWNNGPPVAIIQQTSRPRFVNSFDYNIIDSNVRERIFVNNLTLSLARSATLHDPTSGVTKLSHNKFSVLPFLWTRNYNKYLHHFFSHIVSRTILIFVTNFIFVTICIISRILTTGIFLRAMRAALSCQLDWSNLCSSEYGTQLFLQGTTCFT